MRGWGNLQVYCWDDPTNLPNHEVNDHEGYCWQPCPYSTQATDSRTRALLGLAFDAAVPTKNDHSDENGRVYNMRPQSKGSVWGYECTYDDCPYYIYFGVRYFFI